MNFELPDTLVTWVEEQARLGGFSTPAAFVECVLRAEQRRWREEVEQKLLEALESGEPVAATAEFWQERRRVLAE
jgi:antitoxin ParD1/3/4